MQFSLIVIFIEKRFRGINETFALLAAANNNLTDISISSLSLRKRGLDNYKLFAVKNKIVNLKKSYRSLYEITKSVTKFYSWLLVFAILNFSTVVAYNLYRLAIITIRQQLSTKLCFFVSIWCITYFGPLLTFTGYVSKISSEMSRTGSIIFCIIDKYHSHAVIQAELLGFTDSLLHTKIDFTAAGLFSLDCSLVTSLISSITTYIVILIQFHQDE
ncbi:putative gustatory receptor 28b, partial [Microplitis demolitor]|uniref:putative gustatory receptor 28b n=1 Tax=Microplitis demolitor TaxID=69319 RepID=UPI00235B5BFE